MEPMRKRWQRLHGGEVKLEGCSFEDFVRDVTTRVNGTVKKWRESGGMCANCGKEKAEYPDGFNAYHCKTCNTETKRIVGELQNGGGFTGIKI